MKINKIILNPDTIHPIDNTFNSIYTIIFNNNLHVTGRLVNGQNLYGIYLWKKIK